MPENGNNQDLDLREDYLHIVENVLPDENVLEIKVPSLHMRFLFRDIKGKEIKKVENLLKEGVYIENSIYILGELLLPLRGNSYDDLAGLEFEIYEEVFQSVVNNIIMDIIPWFDFLELAYAFGKKSYSVLPWLLEQDMTLIKDMIHSMEQYLKKEEDYMNEQRTN